MVDVLGGRISNLQCQDHVYLTEARILYIADFKAFDEELKREVWFEAKGYETDVWRIKRRLWMHYGPGPLKVYKGSEKYLKLAETLPGNNNLVTAEDIASAIYERDDLIKRYDFAVKEGRKKNDA